VKLQVNDDGTITFPLRGRPPLTIDEPSMEDIAWLNTEMERVDESLTPIPPVPPDDAPDEARAAFNEATAVRTREIYGEALPYGELVIEIIARVSDEKLARADLYGWASSPKTLRVLMASWRDPLPGEAF
jgi:hypothetical protein